MDRLDAERPLLLVIHPGDAIERACDWSGQEGEHEVVALSASNQQGMAEEIIDKLDSHDVVVLHRISSAYLYEGGVQNEYVDALSQCDQQGVILYGDDLEAATHWMLQNVSGLQEGRLEVFMTGAYANAEHGCITAVGKGLLEANPELKIKVSEWAPTDNNNFLPRWRPLAMRAPAP